MAAEGDAWLRLVRHLTDARTALASGNVDQALADVDAAIALDGGFLAAQSLRDDIVARLPAYHVERPAGPDSKEGEYAQPRPWGVAAARVAAIVGLLMPLLAVATFVWAARAAAWPPIFRSIGGASSPARLVATAALPWAAAPGTVFLATPPVAATPTTAAETGWTSPRLTQLAVRPHWRASAIHVDDAALLRDLEESVSELRIGTVTAQSDAIFVGAVDDGEWATLGSSLKPNGVVWLIRRNRPGVAADADSTTAAVTAGFTAIKRLRYSAGYTATQYARRRARR